MMVFQSPPKCLCQMPVQGWICQRIWWQGLSSGSQYVASMAAPQAVAYSSQFIGPINLQGNSIVLREFYFPVFALTQLLTWQTRSHIWDSHFPLWNVSAVSLGMCTVRNTISLAFYYCLVCQSNITHITAPDPRNTFWAPKQVLLGAG